MKLIAQASPVRWISLLVGLVIVLAGVPILARYERGAQFAYDSTTGWQKIRKRVLGPAGILGTGICRCAPDRRDRLRLPGGFETTVSIYDRGGSGPRPVVVLVHGNTWRGSDLSTYRLLATRMAKEGFVVVTFDRVGKGESDDPFGLGPSAVGPAFDYVAQTDAAVDYVVHSAGIDRQHLAILGHSAGARIALAVGLAREDVSGIVLMQAPPAPPGIRHRQSDTRYWEKRFQGTYAMVYGHGVPNWFARRMIEEGRRAREDPADRLRLPGRKPVMFILGERDEPAGHEAYLTDFQEVAEPKKLVLLQRSDHYLNTGQTFGLVVYDRAVANQITRELVTWLGSIAPPR